MNSQMDKQQFKSFFFYGIKIDELFQNAEDQFLSRKIATILQKIRVLHIYINMHMYKTK